MAAVTKHFGTAALNGTTIVEVTLDERYSYYVYHTGDGADGTDDANSALSAFLASTSGEATPDLSVEDGKYVLFNEFSVDIGPGISTLYLDSTAGADAVLLFTRKGESTRQW